jgi:WD40 repeat protein
MKTEISKYKLFVLGIMVAAGLFFISNKNKSTKVELTKYFESNEGYGDQVVFIDQNKWISVDWGALYCWDKNKLTDTIMLPGYRQEGIVYNPAEKKIYAGTYTIDISSQKAEDLPFLEDLYVERLESSPVPSAGYFALKSLVWNKDGKSIFLYTKFFPSKHLETTSYSGIKGRLLLVDPITKKLSKVIWEGKNNFIDYKLGITDKYLIAAGESLMIFDKNSGDLIKEIDHGSGAVLSLALNHTASILALGKADGVIQTFQMNNEWTSSEYQAHSGRVLALNFHPSSDFLISGSEDKKIKIWKTEKGKLLQLKEETLDSPVEGVAFDPAGKRIAVSRKLTNGIIQLFNINIQK